MSKSFTLNCTASHPAYSAAFRGSKYLEKILANEVVRLLVLSTFRLQLSELELEYPHIFDANCAIPTLVLHGDKDAFVSRVMCTTSGPNDNHPKGLKFPVYVSRKSVLDVPTAAGFGNESDEDDCYMQQRYLRYLARHSQHHPEFSVHRPELVQIREVLPQWPIMDNGSSPRLAIPGVHHPKYILVFTDRGLHVAISTANLTEQLSTDATWCQFFPVKQAHSDKSTDQPAGKSGTHSEDSTPSRADEFGAVLEDFLCQVTIVG